MTIYVVLQKLGATELRVLGATEAAGPGQAIKEWAKGEEGTYVAVPERNWTEQILEVITGAPRVVLRDTSALAPVPLPGQTQLGEQTDAA